MFILPPSSPCIANLNPWPSTAPSKFSFGIRTFSKITILVGCEFHPTLFSFFPKNNPGDSLGTINAEIPCGPGPPVRAITIYTSESPPLLINVLVPLITYSLSFSFAFVDIEVASLPDPGSVKQYDARNSIFPNFSKYMSLCSCVPNLSTIHVHILLHPFIVCFFQK
ncbi:hypothetical protein AYI68_g3141 [Smittium mucronatum]|uniref:Uncharacterized protein n=1 Tax=Smittium mucronatum TaxID=133383 RepID=A0A1R0H0T6_9FUNG|nr:hypothetical protein AYI68_g3141 [Smittium mucronatum]